MKKTKKILALLLCAVLLVGASVAGTLAFLTAKAEITNTFTVGQVSFDADSALDEAKVDEYGVAVSPAQRVTANTYKLIPGHTYTKDPTIHMGADSEACYLFVKVENGIAAIEAATVSGGYTNIDGQIKANGWTLLDGETNIYYKEAAATGASGADYPIFGEFKLKDDAVVSGYATKDNANANITVTAYAIQKDGLSVKQAWDALVDAYPTT
ncbi:MAG: SipW-dependent-type signal peptide-containing protein [Oscillospiraceae bacterium]|nr:SipW-dependent-type signal peptide-containing protein [Oscillospiraceae bacterium]